MRFVTTIYGYKYLPMLFVHLQSIRQCHPDDQVSVFYEDIPGHEIKMLKGLFQNYEFIEGENVVTEIKILQRIPLKVRYWVKACKLYSAETLCLIDCDTALYANISDFIDNSFDILYTWKNERFPLNTGVLIVKNNLNVRTFMNYWLKRIETIVENPDFLHNAYISNGAADQQVLFEILDTRNYDGYIKRNVEGADVTFKGVKCMYLNETNSVSITEATHIIHYKAGWHPILLENAPFTEHRSSEACKEMIEYWFRLYRTIQHDLIHNFVISAALKHKTKIESMSGEFEERGILNSEMLAVCSVAQELDVDIVIESGRCRGQSTMVLAKYFSNTNVKIISIEKYKDENARFAENNLKNYSNTELLYGDSNSVIPRILRRCKGKKVAILFDGPKGEAAINIFKKAIGKYPEVIAGYFHDMRKSAENMLNPCRNIIEGLFKRIFFTDDYKYIGLFKELDQKCLPKQDIVTEHSWSPYRKGTMKIGSYGPTIAVVIPQEIDRKHRKNTLLNILFKLKSSISNRIYRQIRSILNKK